MPTPSPIPPVLQAAADRAVREHNGVTAVVLFGSRARGDHRHDSDYDLAVIGSVPEEVERSLRDAHRGVEVVHMFTQAERAPVLASDGLPPTPRLMSR